MKSNYKEAQKKQKHEEVYGMLTEKERFKYNEEIVEKYIRKYTQRYGKDRLLDILMFIDTNKTVAGEMEDLKEDFKKIISEKIYFELNREFENYLDDNDYERITELCKLQVSPSSRSDFASWILHNSNFKISKSGLNNLAHYYANFFNDEIEVLKKTMPFLIDVGMHTNGFEFLVDKPEMLEANGKRDKNKKLSMDNFQRFNHLREAIEELRGEMKESKLSNSEIERQAINRLINKFNKDGRLKLNINDDYEFGKEELRILEYRKKTIEDRMANKQKATEGEGR